VVIDGLNERRLRAIVGVPQGSKRVSLSSYFLLVGCEEVMPWANSAKQRLRGVAFIAEKRLAPEPFDKLGIGCGHFVAFPGVSINRPVGFAPCVFSGWRITWATHRILTALRGRKTITVNEINACIS